MLAAVVAGPACRVPVEEANAAPLREPALAPPVAPRVPSRTRVHGEDRVDPYAWLRDREDPRTREYLEAENRYADAATQHTAALQETIFKEMLGRIVEDDTSLPVLDGPYAYLVRGVKGKPYEVLVRRPVGPDGRLGPEEGVLDGNAIASGHDYFGVGGWLVSEDHRRVALAYDTEGDERMRIRVVEIASGTVIEEFGGAVGAGMEFDSPVGAWSNDSETLFYTQLDEANRPWQLWRHRVGSRDDDVLVYQEDDARFYVGVERTRSDEFIVVDVTSRTTSESYVLRADEPEGELTILEPRAKDVRYSVDHTGDRFFILTNHRVPDFELMTAPLDTPGRAHWESFAAPSEGGTFASVDAFEHHVVVQGRADGLPQLWVHEMGSGKSHHVDLNQPTYSIWLDQNREFSSTQLRIGFSSPTTPTTIYDYDLQTRDPVERKRDPVPGFNGEDLVTQRVHATASDGTKVPISIIRRRDAPRPAPLVLTGYGAAGMSNDAIFSRNAIVLLERGVTVGVAHVRGGGEFGHRWFQQGKLFHKKNSFTDFISCAEFLIEEGYADSKRLAIAGASAGGFLVAAAATVRPDLFRAVVADMPFVDVVNTMLDPSLPLTAVEWEEWGKPADDPDAYRYMRSYSPYDNVTPQAYPDMLVRAGWNDPQVGYWEPAKWVAKLRATKTDDNLLVLRTDMSSGHLGPSGRHAGLRDEAFMLGFLLDRLSVEK